MAEKTKNIPVRLPLPLHKEATLKRVSDNEKSLQDVIVRLISDWVGTKQERRVAPPRPDMGPDHQMLDVILTKGTRDQILGIRSNLQAFNEAIELRELKAARTPHRKTASG